MLQLRTPRDVLAGVAFVIIGGAALAIGADYRTGTLLSMGPGYFPRVVSGLLLLLGILILLIGLRGRRAEPEAWQIRPSLLVLGGIVAFGLSLERLGLVVAVTLLAVISALAERDRGVVETIALAAGLNLIAWLVFVKALGLPLAVWPAIGAE